MIHTELIPTGFRQMPRRKNPGWPALLFLGVLAGYSIASAHELWLEREGGSYVLHQGHLSQAHAGAGRVPYIAGFVQSAACADEQGEKQALTWSEAYPVQIKASCAAVLVTASSGYWTKTAWETSNVPKTGISGVLKSWRSEDSVKRIDRWSPALAKPLGLGLELSALENPAPLAAGDKLRILVSYEGKPRAGVPVAYDGATRGVSAEDGSIVLRLRRAGLQIISASIDLPLADERADRLLLATTLNFVLARP